MPKNKHLVMGIINITPDSFSDGGEANTVPDLEKKILALLSQQLCIIDIGAQSTAPSSIAVTATEEIHRWQRLFFPVYHDTLQRWENSEMALSIDSYRPETFASIYQMIRHWNPQQKMIWNDVAGIVDQETICILAEQCPDVDYVLTHNLVPTREQCSEHLQYCRRDSDPKTVVGDLINFFRKNQERLLQSKKIDPKRIIFDPGLGFAKSLAENLELLKNLGILLSSFPTWQRWLLGLSRKTFLRHLTGPNDLFSSHRQKLECLQSGLIGLWREKFAEYSLIYRVHDPAVARILYWEQGSVGNN